MQELAKRIAKVSLESKLPIDEEKYVASFKVELMDAVMQWCRGASFSDICQVSFVPSSYGQLWLNRFCHSLQIYSKVASFVCSAGSANYCDRWLWERRSLEIRSFKINSKRPQKCLNVQILSFSAHPCIYSRRDLSVAYLCKFTAPG